jgi:CDP-glucose 4,6-dehydratase
MLNGFFSGKKIFITGHTGFKGAWLSYWLTRLGAQVTGYSIDVPTTPSFFEVLELRNRVTHREGDIRDIQSLKAALKESAAEFVFHLAAQSIVLESFDNPIETFDTNLIGTLQVLEAVRNTPGIRTVIVITTDKVYENPESGQKFIESDPLGGSDPYSASKAGAEIAFKAYFRSFFSGELPKLATARAGNVIGGGDWSAYRIVPDAYRAWADKVSLEIRNPESVRPWQHVLEPLAGYLRLAYCMSEGLIKNGESFNFGPGQAQSLSVRAIVEKLQSNWPDLKWHESKSGVTREASRLELDSTKASRDLNFRSFLDVDTTLDWSARWYEVFRDGDAAKLDELTGKQISMFQELAVRRGMKYFDEFN